MKEHFINLAPPPKNKAKSKKRKRRKSAPKTVACEKCGTKYIKKQLADNGHITHCKHCDERFNRHKMLKDYYKQKDKLSDCIRCLDCGRTYPKSLLKTQGIIYCTNKDCIASSGMESIPIITVTKNAQ